MQCAYRCKIVQAGEMQFGVVYAEYRKAGSRRGKFRPTSEVQEMLNERNSRNALMWRIHANFDKTAFTVDPTYSDDCYPEDEKRFTADVRNYLGRVKKIYDAAGVEFKWVCIKAYGEEKGRLHIHFVFSGGVDKDLVKAAWGMGRLNYKVLEFDELGVVDLSRYIFDQRHFGSRRWTCSRNCRKPVEKVDRNRWSAKKLRMLAETANPHQAFADMYPGYWLGEYPQVHQNPVNGSWYMTFVMYQPSGKNLSKYARRGK